LIGASIPGAAFSQPPLAVDPSRGWLITQASSDAATYFSADGGKSWRVLCASPPGGCEHTTTCGEGVGLFGDVLLVATNKEAKGCGYYCASSDFHRAVIDVQNTTVTCRWEKRQPVPVFHPRDEVGASAARRFVRAPDQTIYYGLQTMSSGAPETDRAYGFEGVYASTDLGKTFEARGKMPTATGESDIMPLNGTHLIAVARLQNGHGKVPMTIPGPHYKQSGIVASSDSGRTWSQARVVTGGLQQTACLVRTGESLLLVFGHKDEGLGQRMIVSYDGGHSFSKTAFDLHVGGMYASSVVSPTKDGEIVTVMDDAPFKPAGEGHSSTLQVLHWKPPPRALVETGGFFVPEGYNDSSAVGEGTFVPWDQSAGHLYGNQTKLNQSCGVNGQPELACWSRVFPRLAHVAVDHVREVDTPDGVSTPAAAVTAADEIVVQGETALWRNAGAGFERWCEYPPHDDSMLPAGLGVLHGGSIVMLLAQRGATVGTRLWSFRTQPNSCAWGTGAAVPLPSAEERVILSTTTRIQETSSGSLLFPVILLRGSVYRAVLCVSSDSGAAWKVHTELGEHIRRVDLVRTGHGWVAAGWLRTADYIPEYNQIAISRCTEESLTNWTPWRAVTNYMEQTASLVASNDATVLVFGEGNGTVRQSPHGQRFMISYTGGASWSETLFQLETSVAVGSSAVHSNGSMVTVFTNGGKLGSLRWQPPPRATVEAGGRFRPGLVSLSPAQYSYRTG
jgi:hypothetical protein